MECVSWTITGSIWASHNSTRKDCKITLKIPHLSQTTKATKCSIWERAKASIPIPFQALYKSIPKEDLCRQIMPNKWLPSRKIKDASPNREMRSKQVHRRQALLIMIICITTTTLCTLPLTANNHNSFRTTVLTSRPVLLPMLCIIHNTQITTITIRFII